MNSVIRFLEDSWPVSDSLKSDLEKCLETIEVMRNEMLLTAGEVSTKIYFVSQGLLMKWHDNGADIITTGFSKENEICVSCASFFDQVGSKEFIQALERSVLFCISYENYSDLTQRHREFTHVCRKLLVRTVQSMEDYTYGINRKRAVERYLWFADRFPDLEYRILQRHIAQFLSMSPITLCIARIRANELRDVRVREVLLSGYDRSRGEWHFHAKGGS